jgi:thiamine kinase
MTALAARGWCSDVLWSDVQKGVLVVPFVPGRVWTDEDMQQSGQLERLATLLCRLHKCSAQLPLFGLIDRVKSYSRFLGTTAAAQCAESIVHLLAETVDSGRTAVCHNDPVAGNVVDDAELHLIDFEFAAAGNPLFDLAAVIEHHRLPTTRVEVFTKAYIQAGGSCDTRLLEQWRIIYGQTTGLWNQIVAV